MSINQHCKSNRLLVDRTIPTFETDGYNCGEAVIVRGHGRIFGFLKI